VLLRAGNASAGTIVQTGSGAHARTPLRDGDTVTAAPVTIARTRATDAPSTLLEVEGVGSVDPRLIHEMYMAPYEAGQVSANAVRLRVIKLTGSSIK
jgi:hypothetical protein